MRGADDARSGAGPSPAPGFVSAIVCTFRRPDCLQHALDSLARQTLAPAAFEVVVVNNDPADARIADVVTAAGLGRRLRLVACATPGLSHARNAGLAAARGEFVAFLDDDALATPTWLAAVRDAFAAHPPAGVAGGTIRLDPPLPRPRWLRPGWEHFWSQRLIEGETPRPARDWTEYPWGANWAARRAPLLEAGGFPTDYGRGPTDFAGGEEIVAAAALQRRGWDVLLVPDAVVVHRPPADRYTLRHVWERVLSARREEYRQRRDGHIAPPPRARDLLRDTLHDAAGVVRPRTGPWHRRLEAAMRAGAALSLLPWLVRDRARLRATAAGPASGATTRERTPPPA